MKYLLIAAMAAAPAVGMGQRVAALPPKSGEYERASKLPADPLQRMAYQAVVLRLWPDIAKWKLGVYKEVLEHGYTAHGLAKRTTYCPHCSGTTCADGSRVRGGICAASRNVPMHSIVWLETEGLLKVTDRGGAVKVPGGAESAHFDVWVPDCAGGCWTGPGTRRAVPWAVIPVH